MRKIFTLFLILAFACNSVFAEITTQPFQLSGALKSYTRFYAQKKMKIEGETITVEGPGSGLRSGGTIGVEAEKTVKLLSTGVVAVEDINLTSRTEDVVVDITSSFPSVIESLKKSVTMEAGRNVDILGSYVKSGKDINLKGLTINVFDKVRKTSTQTKTGYEEKVEFLPSKLSSNRNITSEGDFHIRGSEESLKGKHKHTGGSFSVTTSKEEVRKIISNGKRTILMTQDVLSRPEITGGELDVNSPMDAILFEGALVNLGNGFILQAPNIAFRSAYARTQELILEAKRNAPKTVVPNNPVRALLKNGRMVKETIESKPTSTQVTCEFSNINAFNEMTSEGLDMNAETTIDILAGKFTDTPSKETKEVKYSNSNKQEFSLKNHNSTYQSKNHINIETNKDDLTLTSTKLRTHDIWLRAKKKVNLLISKNIDYVSETKTRKNLLFIKHISKGHNHETSNMCEILGNGGLIIEGKNGTLIEVSKEQLKNNPATAWVEQFRSNPTVMWEKIEEQHKNWNRTQRTLTPAAAGVLGLGISLVTSGWGASLLSLGGVAGKIASTALTNIMSRASISLINNQGDLGKVFKELSSSKSLRSFAVLLASTGITGIIGLPTEAQGFEQHLKSNLINTGVSSSLSVIIEGKDPKEALGEALRTITAHTLGGMIANEIGESYSPLKGMNRIDPVTHKIFHGILGGGMGMIMSKKPFEGILPGALGSVASECLAEMLTPDDPKTLVGKIYSENPNLSDEEFIKQYSQGLEIYKEQIQTSAKWAKFGAGVIAMSLGQDVDIAIETAKNSVDNNFMMVLPALVVGGRFLIVAGLQAYRAYRIYQSTQMIGSLFNEALDNQQQLQEENSSGGNGGSLEPEGGDEEKNPKPQGVNNPKVKEHLDYGNKRHDEFKKENENIHINPKNSKHRPDLNTENAVHELKPGTISGVKKGLPQLQRYQDVYEKPGLLHLYEPKNTRIDLNRIVEKNFKNNPLVNKIIENIKNNK